MQREIHWTEITLRPTDVDDVGHVNNVIFAGLVATGRMDFIGRHMTPAAAPGSDFWLVRIELDYVKQLFYPGIARVGTTVARVGTKSITLGHEVHGSEELVAHATSILVYVDRATSQGLDIPPLLREAL